MSINLARFIRNAVDVSAHHNLINIGPYQKERRRVHYQITLHHTFFANLIYGKSQAKPKKRDWLERYQMLSRERTELHTEHAAEE